MIEISEIHKGVILITSPKQYVINDMFMRPQEFYESPIEGIRGCIFNTDTFIRLYSEHMGQFDYHTEWVGFNLPGKVLQEFIDIYISTIGLRPSEYDMLSLLSQMNITPADLDQYYIIGTNTTEKDYLDTMDHEICHAFWTLRPDFQEHARSMLGLIPSGPFNILRKNIKDRGYAEEVLDDEMCAYLTTSPADELSKKYGINKGDIPANIMESFKERFKMEKEL